MQNRYELWDTEPRNEYQRCPYTGISTWYDAQADEWIGETPRGTRRSGRSQGEAFSEALDAFRIEREHARTNDEIPFDGSPVIRDEEFATAWAQDRDSAL